MSATLTEVKPKPRRLAAVREKPAAEGLAVWELWTDAGPYPSLKNAYRFVKLADAGPTLERLARPGSGAKPLYPQLRHVVWPLVKALTEVYCEVCGQQTGNYASPRAERRLVICRDCSCKRYKPWKTEEMK